LLIWNNGYRQNERPDIDPVTRRAEVPTYINLVRFTEDGIRNIKDSPKRLDATREYLQSLGGKITGYYLTMDRYDVIVTLEYPNDEVAMISKLKMESTGSVRIDILRVFPEDEYRKIIEQV
jgi:uncharacterized protein with GYD domain